MKVLQGEPVLVDAATDAISKWRAQPASIDGTLIETISIVTFDFELP
jgi:outer membrane biosynthesis protein TonB